MSRAAAHATVYSAIADPNRRAILDVLLGGERAAGALLRWFEFTQSALSQHLRILRRAGLVSVRRRGRLRLYRLRARPLREVADWVRGYDRFWSGRLDRLERHLERTHGPAKAD